MPNKFEISLDTEAIEDSIALLTLALKTGMFFNQDNHAEISEDLRYLQQNLNTLVTLRDSEAEIRGIDRLVGKRGRKSADQKVNTVEDIKAQMRKNRK